MKLRIASVAVGILSLVLSLVPLTVAQTTSEAASALPRLVRFGGTVKDLNGNPLTGVVGITFALYSEQTGGAALWLETQNVTADSNGHYVALLGSTKPDGLPTELFTSEQARWVGVQVSGQPEQPRVLLLSVPYALKAADAETLGGKPASAYLLGPQQTEGAPASAQSNPAAAGKAPNTDKSAVSASVSGSGTTNYIPLWTSSSNLGNSMVFQSTTGYLGIGTTSPAAKLDIRGATGLRVTTIHGASGTAGVFNNTGGGNILIGQSNGTVLFSVNGSGVTQVGTQSTTPAGMLNATATLAGAAGVAGTGGVGDIGAPGLLGNGGPGGYTGGTGVVGIGATGGLGSVGGNGVEGYAAGGGAAGGVGVVGYGTNPGYVGTEGVLGIGGGGAIEEGGAGIVGIGGPAAQGSPPQASTGGAGVQALGSANDGVAGTSGDGIYATNPDGGTAATGGYAGYFSGDINVTGAVYAGTKDFRIDHPTDPANKYLLHGSVESSEMMNIYSGNATLDGSGQAVVQLPAWFEAVNGDFRYQLTSIGAPGPGLYIAQKISGNRFKIAGGSAGSEVSWQVTAVRHDAYAKAYPLIVEQEKGAKERGHYIHPELYGAPKEQGIAWTRYPEAMRPVKRKAPPHSPKIQPAKVSSK